MQLSIKSFNSKRTVIFSILGISFLLIALIVGIFNFNALIGSLLEKVNLKEKSYASLSFEKEKVNLSFNVVDSDKQSAIRFSKQLGISNDWMEGISLGLDERTVNLLRGNLPEKINLSFEEDGISFSSPTAPLLKSSLTGKNYEISTASGSLSLKASSERDYDIKIIEPFAVLNYLSKSGKVYLSSKTERFLPSLQKVARIEVRVRNAEIKGKIQLK